MAETDKLRWDQRYQGVAAADPHLPERFVPFVQPAEGVTTALEIACGTGQASVWLAQHGVRCAAFDISAVAIEAANQLARDHEVSDRCSFAVTDFDDGLPPGDQVDLVLCNLFRDSRLDGAIIDRLVPGGMLAIAALSEVGAQSGRFRVPPGELTNAFAALKIKASGEAEGVAWLVGIKP